MKYALLIHLGEGLFDQLFEAEKQGRMDKHRQLQQDARKAGHYGGGVRLATA